MTKWRIRYEAGHWLARRGVEIRVYYGTRDGWNEAVRMAVTDAEATLSEVP